MLAINTKEILRIPWTTSEKGRLDLVFKNWKKKNLVSQRQAVGEFFFIVFKERNTYKERFKRKKAKKRIWQSQWIHMSQRKISVNGEVGAILLCG